MAKPIIGFEWNGYHFLGRGTGRPGVDLPSRRSALRAVALRHSPHSSHICGDRADVGHSARDWERWRVALQNGPATWCTPWRRIVGFPSFGLTHERSVELFRNEETGLEPMGEDVRRVFFCNTELGEFNSSEMRFRPALRPWRLQIAARKSSPPAESADEVRVVTISLLLVIGRQLRDTA